MENNWIWIAIILPVIVGLFKSEIGSFLLDLKIYKTKEFSEGDEVELLNTSLGKWGKVIILDYTFSLSPHHRVVTFQHTDGHIEHIPFKIWASMRKAAGLKH